MRSQNKRTRINRATFIIAMMGVSAFLMIINHAGAEERKFVVTPAHSPKAFVTNGVPGLPPGGLFPTAIIRKDYFDRIDPSIDSFAEYWEEISYGDVIVTGDVTGWVTLPWVFDPNPPNAPARPSPANYIDLRSNTMTSEGLISLPPFAYGAGEDFCDVDGIGGTSTVVSLNKCGALIILDVPTLDPDNPNRLLPEPIRRPGLIDIGAVGFNVWTPGERFLDLDGDNRWDGMDEVNDMMCHGPDGCRDRLCSITDFPCLRDTDCPLRNSDGETCRLNGDPLGSGPRGCNTPGCGDLELFTIDWNDDGAFVNCPGPDEDTFSGCTMPELESCNTDLNCSSELCIETASGKFCRPDNCAVAFDSCNVQLLPCCDTLDPDSDDPCDDGEDGIDCGGPPVIICCEFEDLNGDGTASFPEPFEDFMVRWNPDGVTAGSVWVPVDANYIRNNYPGDADALVKRTGNGYYDSPDLFIDRNNTKMMQDASLNRFAWRTPKPGAKYSGAPNLEKNWFDSFWTDRYGSTAPPWPGGNSASPPFNSPIMRPFDPNEPVPPIARGTPGRRFFNPNRGGVNGFGVGTLDDPGRVLVVGLNELNEPTEAILPEEVFGYYDGWVEHDDLPSSIYHSEGDKRLGEITAPTFDTVTVPGTDDGSGDDETYTAIFGVDLGKNNPFGGADNADPDNFCVAAGPGAVNIHGEKGFDAGDACIVEWLTWRTDGTSPTTGSQWALDNGNYHPFASRVGFQDYNLDGMIDQGEVRPELSENYSVDSDPFTNPNKGYTRTTNYPFNRLRLMEDIVEALDPSIDFDDFVTGNTVSGIALVPAGSYADPDLFPFAPNYYRIQTQDVSGLLFHDLVICQNCRGFPSAVGYSAHEYLHTWFNYPDLYDYDVFDEPLGDDINCPIGQWDIMSRFGGLVHPNPVLKKRSRWIDTVDLKSILTPGVERTLTLPPAEFVRDDSYYFLENSEKPGERYYFWSAGSGFDERFPGQGMLILRTIDSTANREALALQQRTPPFNFVFVQADAQGDLEACSSSGNTGDNGDLWPGSTNKTMFDLNTDPPATWQDTRWTGLTISNIEPDGNGSILLTLSWVPTSIPSLSFIDPPGGESVGSIYQVRFEATDVHGGTTIKLYFTTDPEDISIKSNNANLIGILNKPTPGTSRLSVDWNLSALPDGRYFVFAKLIPGTGSDGTERSFSIPRAGRNNRGDGSLVVNSVNINDNISSTARAETWTAVCIDQRGREWKVNSSLTQPEPVNPDDDPFPHVFTCSTSPAQTGLPDCNSAIYVSIGSEVRFNIVEGATPFELGDRFSFSTTGTTSVSKSIIIENHQISGNPQAVIHGSPLSGRPPLTVHFDATDSTDPEDLPLDYNWNFGDGSTGSGPQIEHTYLDSGTFTVILRATNPFGRLGESAVDINVTNNSPSAFISASPTSGSSPLTVSFNASESTDTETPNNELIYQWDFDDGVTVNNQGAAGSFIQVQHRYETRENGTACTSSNPCLFDAILSVTDGGGKKNTASIRIIVGNSSPIARVATDKTQGDAPLQVIFNASTSFDPDGDSMTIDWHWDDGSSEIGLPITENGKSHTYDNPGFYSPTAIVKDGNGGEDTWPGVVINVIDPNSGPSNPTAIFCFVITNTQCDINPPTLKVNESFSVDASASFDRPANGAITSYTWDWGDNTSTSSGVTASHIYTEPGCRKIRLTVEDNELPPLVAIREIRVCVADDSIIQPDNGIPTARIVVVPDPPEGLVGDSFTFDANTSSDPDNDPLIYNWSFGDGAKATAPIVTHSYSSVGDYNVRLTARDPFNASSSVNIKVTILENNINRSPTAVIATGPRSGIIGDEIEFDGSLSFDPDGDPISYNWEFKFEGVFDETFDSSKIRKTFTKEGRYTVELEVDDNVGNKDRSKPQTISITTHTITGDTDPPDPTGPGLFDPPSSQDQRPGILCGFGMIMSLFGTLIGLFAMMVSRRRSRL